MDRECFTLVDWKIQSVNFWLPMISLLSQKAFYILQVHNSIVANFQVGTAIWIDSWYSVLGRVLLSIVIFNEKAATYQVQVQYIFDMFVWFHSLWFGIYFTRSCLILHWMLDLHFIPNRSLIVITLLILYA